MAHASDGSPVGSFGSGGRVDLRSAARTVQPAFAGDGDPLVLAGRGGSSAGEVGMVLRYRRDGSVDKGFGRGGRYTMRLGRKPVSGAAILTGPGERILVGGSLGRRFAVASLLPDGKPDPRFGSDGWLVVKLGAATHGMTLSRIGRYVYLAGIVGDHPGDEELVLMRFDRRGRLDRNFGHGARRATAVSYEEGPVSVLSTPNGPLVVMTDTRRPLLTFGKGGGARRAGVGNGRESVRDVSAALDGNRVVVGWTTGEESAVVYHLARRPLGKR
jgi:hypothetical protein